VSFDGLRGLAPDLWVVETPLRFRGLEVGRRMAVVRLSSGELLIHSPASLTPELRAALDELGTTRFVVPASSLHGHLYMEEYRAGYPDAELFAAPGLGRKRRDLDFDGFLGDAADARWSKDLDQAAVHGNRFLTEIVFLHRHSRSLIVGDLCFKIGASAPPPMRSLARAARAYQQVRPAPLFRWGFRDRRAGRSSLERILDWDFDRIVVGHGEMVEQGGREALRQAYAWLM
jgi:Domain of unknown function (DUF4336)